MKIRKFTAVMLILAMLAVPTFALGETTSSTLLEAALIADLSNKVTITFEPGQALTQDPATSPIADLLTALKVEAAMHVTADAQLFSSEIFLSDKSAIDMTQIIKGNQLYYKSNLLGEKAVSITMEDYFQFIADQLKAQGEAELAAIYESYGKLYASLLNGELTLPEFDQQSLQQDLVMPLTEWFTTLMSTPQMTTGTFESEKHNTATSQIVYTLSAAQISDLVTIVTNWAGKDVNLDAILSFASSIDPANEDLALVKTDIQEALKTMPEGLLTDLTAAMPTPFTVTTLMDNDGNLAAFEAALNVAASEEGEASSDILIGYYVKTEANGTTNQLVFDVTSGTSGITFDFTASDDTTDGEQWQATVSVKENAAEVFGLNLDYIGSTIADDKGSTETWKLNAAAGVAGQMVGIVLDNTTTTGDDQKTKGKLDIYLAGETGPLVSILSVTEPIEAMEIPTFDDTDVVNPIKMTEEEMTSWMDELSTNLNTQLTKVMMSLPPSVLMMLSGGATN